MVWNIVESYKTDPPEHYGNNLMKTLVPAG